ncbi:MAG: sugar diacid recognition domain-containing protein [Termitinemataceae bacterium]
MKHAYSIKPDLAKKIVTDIKTVSGADANVISYDGLIIASYDPNRVGTIHEAGRRIMHGEMDEIAITPEMAASMKGTRPGYNGVIKLNGERIAVIGIAGDPQIVKPLQKMAEIAVKEEIQREIDTETERQKVREMEQQIIDIAERMKVLSLNGSIQAAKLGEKGKPFKIVVAEMRKLAEQINDIIKSIDQKRSRQV